MARKKRVVVLEDPEEDLLQEEAHEAREKDREEKEVARQRLTDEWLAEFQEKFSEQPVKVLIEKYDESGEWCTCRKYMLSAFDQERLRDEFGGGRYRATLLGTDGRYIKESRNYFKFAEPLKREPEIRRPENPLENPMVLMMIKSMETQQAQTMELTKSMIAAQGSAAPKSGGLVEMIEAMKALRTMTPQDKPLDNFKETLGMMKLVKEVTGDSEGDSKGGLLSDLKDVLEVLPQLKEHMATLKVPALGPAPGAPEARPVMDPLSQKIVSLVPKFVEAARAAAPVPEWGAFLLDTFDVDVMPVLLPVMQKKFKALVKDESDVYDIILRYAKDPEERDNVFKQIPPLAMHREWVLRVIEEAVRLAEEPDTEEESPGGSAILTAVMPDAPNGSHPIGSHPNGSEPVDSHE